MVYLLWLQAVICSVIRASFQTFVLCNLSKQLKQVRKYISVKPEIDFCLYFSHLISTAVSSDKEYQLWLMLWKFTFSLICHSLMNFDERFCFPNVFQLGHSSTSLHAFQHSERQSSSMQESRTFEESQQFQCIQAGQLGKGQRYIVCHLRLSSAMAGLPIGTVTCSTVLGSKSAKAEQNFIEREAGISCPVQKCLTPRNRLCDHPPCRRVTTAKDISNAFTDYWISDNKNGILAMPTMTSLGPGYASTCENSDEEFRCCCWVASVALNCMSSDQD